MRTRLLWCLCLCLMLGSARAEKIDGVHEADNAHAVSKIRVPKSPKGFFFRGDNRTPTGADGTGVFDTGFVPQGTNPDLNRHLSFAGNSAYVSTSRSDIAAQSYMFGRTGMRTRQGFLYVIAPDDLPDGYWIPGIYRRAPAVRANHEYAVFGHIDRRHIAGAFHYSDDATNPIEWIPNPHYAYAHSSPYNPSRDGYFSDICGAVSAIAQFLCIRPHPHHNTEPQVFMMR